MAFLPGRFLAFPPTNQGKQTPMQTPMKIIETFQSVRELPQQLKTMTKVMLITAVLSVAAFILSLMAITVVRYAD